MKSRLITISAVSASLTATVLTVGAYVEFVDLIALMLSTLFVILPLYYNSYVASLLSFLAGGVIALLFSGFNFLSVVFPAYFGFFGIYPIIRHLMYEKNFNKWLGHVIRLVWLVVAFYGVYFYYTLVMMIPLENLPAWATDAILYLVGGVAVVFYFVFDRFIRVSKILIDRYLKRIIK